MNKLDELKQSNPELYAKLLDLAVNLYKLPRRERRKTQRNITKMINKANDGSTETTIDEAQPPEC